MFFNIVFLNLTSELLLWLLRGDRGDAELAARLNIPLCGAGWRATPEAASAKCAGREIYG